MGDAFSAVSQRKSDVRMLFFHGALIVFLLKSARATVSLLAQLCVSKAMCSLSSNQGWMLLSTDSSVMLPTGPPEVSLSAIFI